MLRFVFPTGVNNAASFQQWCNWFMRYMIYRPGLSYTAWSLRIVSFPLKHLRISAHYPNGFRHLRAAVWMSALSSLLARRPPSAAVLNHTEIDLHDLTCQLRWVEYSATDPVLIFSSVLRCRLHLPPALYTGTLLSKCPSPDLSLFEEFSGRPVPLWPGGIIHWIACSVMQSVMALLNHTGRHHNWRIWRQRQPTATPLGWLVGWLAGWLVQSEIASHG